MNRISTKMRYLTFQTLSFVKFLGAPYLNLLTKRLYLKVGFMKVMFLANSQFLSRELVMMVPLNSLMILVKIFLEN